MSKPGVESKPDVEEIVSTLHGWIKYEMFNEQTLRIMQAAYDEIMKHQPRKETS